MNPLFLLTALATAAVLALTANPEPPASVRHAARRILRQMLVIAAAAFASLLLLQPLSHQMWMYSETPVRDTTILTVLAYLYVNRRTIPKSSKIVLAIVPVAATASLVWFIPTQFLNMTSMIFLPALIPLLKHVDLSKGVTFPSLFPDTRHMAKFTQMGDMHFRTRWIEIERKVGTEELVINYTPDPDLIPHSAHGVTLATTAPLLWRDPNKSPGAAWRPNAVVNASRDTLTHSGVHSTTSWVPGTTSYGTTLSGEMITIQTPGYSVTTPGEPYSYETDSPYTVTTLSVVCDGENRELFVGRLYDDEFEVFESTLEAILAGAQEGAQALNVTEQQDAARRKAERDEREHQERVQAEQLHSERLHAEAERMCAQAGIDPEDRFVTYSGRDGKVTSLLAADRSGQGALVGDNGTAVWFGSWHGAQARIEGTRLAVVVDDADYCTTYLAQRRHRVDVCSSQQRHEWRDRINLLGQNRPEQGSIPD